MLGVGALKIEGARFLLTMDAGRRIIADASVVVQDGRIAQVGKAAELAAVPAAQVIDARRMVVVPGFCNAHMHISYAHAVRSVFPDDLGPAYLPTVFALQGAMTAEEEYLTTLLGVTELLKYGTTCFLDPGSAKFLDAIMPAFEAAGCRVIVGAHTADRPNLLNLPVLPTAAAVKLMQQTIEQYDGALDGRVRAWAMPFSPAFSTPDLLREAKALADAARTGLTLHFSHSPAYVDECLAEFGQRPAQYLESLGVLGGNTLLSHCIGLDLSEVEAMARTGTKAAIVPTAAVKAGFGMTQTGLLPEMLEAEIVTGIGTDAGNNSNLIETHRALYLIAVLYNDARRRAGVISPETALELATITGAAALGLDAEIGSIEVGKKADLVLYETDRPEWAALFNPVNSLVFNADGRSVHTVIVDGRIVVENHQPQFVDEAALIAQVQAAGESLLSRTGHHFPPRWPVV